MKKYALFIGRWQPFHNGHKYIIDQALKSSKNVCIAIRETKIDQDNPYTINQRKEMIKRIYRDQVKIISLPDIASINIGRRPGYDLIRYEVPPAIRKISATRIRNKKDENLPPAVKQYILSLNQTLWFIGLPCSGKTTLAKKTAEYLKKHGFNVVILDADTVRKGVNKDLGFSAKDRQENLKRAASIAQLLNKQNIFVIAAFITPSQKARLLIKRTVSNIKFIYTRCAIKECLKRDTKGMYRKAKEGLVKDFTGISAPFEVPGKVDIIVDTDKHDIESCVKQILRKLFLQ